MKKLVRKIIALSLCAALCVGGAGMALAEPEQTRSTKDETVYVLADATGSVRQVIVSDWLKNAAGEDTLSDRSALTDIENVKGEESFTADGETLTWNAAGNDIYYRGNTDRELPVSVSISYRLDGEDISVTDLLGKSGRVTIRFDYENHQYETVEVNGKSEKIYVPFAAVTGMLLDNDSFRNVEVTNGKLVNDGDHTAVVGVALPGMQESLGVDQDTLEIPDYVEISADVTDFEMGMTLTLVTNEVFNALEDTPLDSTEDMSDAVNKLTDAMTQLTDGTDALEEGLATLLEKSGELADGVQQLTDGAVALQDGADQLNAGAAELTEGLNTLVSNNDTLNSGAEQVFNTLLATATAQLRAAGVDVQDLTIENYGEVLSSVMGSLSPASVSEQARDQVAAVVEANRAAVVEKVTAAVREQVSAKVTEAVREEVAAQVTEAVRAQVTAGVVSAVTGLTQDAYQAAVEAGQITAEQQAAIAAAVDAKMQEDGTQAQIAAAIDAQMNGETAQAAIASNLDAQMQSQEVQALIDQNVEQTVASLIEENMNSAEVQSKLAEAASGLETISKLKDSLDSYNAFYTGLKTYTDGVASAAEGASAILSGSSDLYDGAGQLSDGLTQLNGSVPALVDGVTQLHDGAQQLSDGLKEFSDESIQKLSGLVDGDLDTLLARVNAIVDASRNYRTFSGLDSTMDGQVRFIYRTDEAN